MFLGTLRGALAVIIGIPAAMSIALFGMHATGVTGDLMSLGAIDFGFLVDGAIVMLEAVIAAAAGKKLACDARLGELARTSASVARPVVFAIAIIMLVYLPLLTLEGIEGKMFRPTVVRNDVAASYLVNKLTGQGMRLGSGRGPDHGAASAWSPSPAPVTA